MLTPPFVQEQSAPYTRSNSARMHGLRNAVKNAAPQASFLIVPSSLPFNRSPCHTFLMIPLISTASRDVTTIYGQRCLEHTLNPSKRSSSCLIPFLSRSIMHQHSGGSTVLHNQEGTPNRVQKLPPQCHPIPISHSPSLRPHTHVLPSHKGPSFS